MSSNVDAARSMPLVRIWLGAFALVTCGLAIAWPPPAPKPDYSDAYFHFERLNDPPPRLVFVGTSLLASALPYDRPAKEYLPAANPDERTVRIIRYGHDAPLMTRILRHCVEAKPAVIVAQIEPYLVHIISAGQR